MDAEMNTVKPKIVTEDTGKIFEMAICLTYRIPYVGKYKYSMDSALILKERLHRLVDLCPMCRHTAEKGSQYDFTGIKETDHLSAKSTKGGVGKVAPQVIGQCQPQKFCEIVGIEYTTNRNLKEYIQTNKLTILPILVSYTFDCPTVYYNRQEDTIRYITLNKDIEWDKYNFRWTCDFNKWKNSTTLKVVTQEREFAILEFQFHTKSRTNMAIRWFYENFLTLFNDNLSIIKLN
jgi:hypothetical protein